MNGPCKQEESICFMQPCISHSLEEGFPYTKNWEAILRIADPTIPGNNFLLPRNSHERHKLFV